MLEIRDVSFQYTNQNLFEKLNLQFERGVHTAIVGPSGCGKSTLLKLLTGLLTLKSGRILLDQKELTKVAPCNRKIGMLFQDYALFPHLTVEKNILFANKNANVKELLKLIELEGFEKRYPHQLSGGQAQRVALARVLATEPEYILLDEPFANYDTELKINVRVKIQQILAKTKTTLILVSHDLTDVDELCTKVIKL